MTAEELEKSKKDAEELAKSFKALGEAVKPLIVPTLLAVLAYKLLVKPDEKKSGWF